MEPLHYVWAGVLAVVQGPAAFEILGFGVPITIVMVFAGLVLGIVVGATPGLAGPVAMAISLPILISAFGYTPDALLPVLGFLIGIMKGATVGGAVPAILFNTPGTPDAYMTTFDGFPLAQQGKAGKALRTAHFSSVTGDTVSDIVLFLCAPFLAVLVEGYLDLPEKTALLILSLCFIAAVIGQSPAKGLLSVGLGLLVVFIGTGEDFYPRLSLNAPALSNGIPITAAVLGVLIIGAVFIEMEKLWHEKRERAVLEPIKSNGDQHLTRSEIARLLPHILRSSAIGTAIGALPGIGTTLAATLGYSVGRNRHEKSKKPGDPAFGSGAIEGLAATEAANSSVSGANLIPVLSLGIPGNTAAVFLILAAESIGGFNPGPAVFQFTKTSVNPELVIAFGLFTTMVIANLLNWTVGGLFMRWVGIMSRIPKDVLLPFVLLLTLTAIYVQETSMPVVWFALAFGVLGYLMRKSGISPLPFVIAFVLGGKLEESARQAYATSGGDKFFLFSSPTATVFVIGAIAVVGWSLRKSPN